MSDEGYRDFLVNHDGTIVKECVDANAIDAKDATIATLREEIAALKAEVERLKGESKWAAEVYEISLEERKKLKSRAEAAEADASIIRKIREIRKGMKVGTPCGCEFGEEDDCIRRCALHSEVYDKLELAEAKLEKVKNLLGNALWDVKQILKVTP